MSIAHVITGGFGNGTFSGEIRQIMLDGFFDSAVAPVLVDQVPNFSARFDSGAHVFQIEGYFTGETSFALDPPVETGWSFDTDTGELTIDTDDDGIFGPYIVTATNTAGSTDSNPFTVKVSDASIPLYGDGFNFSFRVGF